jgi:hypothetical protein
MTDTPKTLREQAHRLMVTAEELEAKLRAERDSGPALELLERLRIDHDQLDLTLLAEIMEEDSMHARHLEWLAAECRNLFEGTQLRLNAPTLDPEDRSLHLEVTTSLGVEAAVALLDTIFDATWAKEELWGEKIVFIATINWA